MSDLPGRTYILQDADEYVSWAFNKPGGLQLIADRLRRAEKNASEARIAFAAYKALNGECEEKIKELNNIIQKKNELLLALVEIALKQKNA